VAGFNHTKPKRRLKKRTKKGDGLPTLKNVLSPRIGSHAGAKAGAEAAIKDLPGQNSRHITIDELMHEWVPLQPNCAKKNTGSNGG